VGSLEEAEALVEVSTVEDSSRLSPAAASRACRPGILVGLGVKKVVPGAVVLTNDEVGMEEVSEVVG
jgi:uncharacterized protein (DUF3084 family)